MVDGERVGGKGVVQQDAGLLGSTGLHMLWLSSTAEAKMKAPSSPLQVLPVNCVEDFGEGVTS